jgi:hypothetical protein
MFNTYFKIFIICSALSLITSDNPCSTPVDCYVKAIAVLNRDREEMRLETDSLKVQISELKKDREEMRLETDSLKVQISELKKTIEGYEKARNEDKKELNEKINLIANKNNSIAPNIPDVIRCGDRGEQGAVFFLHNYSGSGGIGDIWYFQVGYIHRGVIFSRDGAFKNIESDNYDSTIGCRGKSLEQLKNEKRTFNIAN